MHEQMNRSGESVIKLYGSRTSFALLTKSRLFTKSTKFNLGIEKLTAVSSAVVSAAILVGGLFCHIRAGCVEWQAQINNMLGIVYLHSK